MSRPTTPTSEFFSNFEGFLKKFKLTTENHKDQEILTLANLDSGRIRKFIVKKVDEKSLFGRRNSQKSSKDENENKSRKPSFRKKSLKKEKKQENRRKLSTSSLHSLKASYGNMKRFGSSKSLTVEPKSFTPEKKKRRSSFGSGRFKLGWGSSSEESESDDMFECKNDSEKQENIPDPGFTNDVIISDQYKNGGPPTSPAEKIDDVSENNRMNESDADSLCSLDSESPSSSPRFNLKMSPVPKRSKNKRVEPQYSPVSFRGGYQSNRSSISSVRKGILKKTNSSTTINMEMNNLSRPQTPTENKSVESFEEAYSNGDTTRFTRSGDNPHLRHQRSFNRVKFILDSGRPDNITGDYDDIKIEKNDKTDRGDKGKIMTNSNEKKLTRSGRKCLIFSAGLLVMTMAVILGSFYGSRKTPKALAIDEAENKIIPSAYEGKFKILNENFVPALYEATSEEYKKLSRALEVAVARVIFHDETLVNGVNSTIKLKFVRYELGSVESFFRIKWLYKEAKLEIPEINKRVWKHLEKYGAFGEYKIERSSFSIGELLDQCGKKGCSHICALSDETLRFDCFCTDGLILTNATICLPPKPTTTTEKNPVKIPPIINKILKVSNADLVSVNQETVESVAKVSEDQAENKTRSNSTAENKGEVTNEELVNASKNDSKSMSNSTLSDHSFSNVTNEGKVANGSKVNETELQHEAKSEEEILQEHLNDQQTKDSEKHSKIHQELQSSDLNDTSTIMMEKPVTPEPTIVKSNETSNVSSATLNHTHKPETQEDKTGTYNTTTVEDHNVLNENISSPSDTKLPSLQTRETMSGTEGETPSQIEKSVNDEISANNVTELGNATALTNGNQTLADGNVTALTNGNQTLADHSTTTLQSSLGENPVHLKNVSESVEGSKVSGDSNDNKNISESSEGQISKPLTTSPLTVLPDDSGSNKAVSLEPVYVHYFPVESDQNETLPEVKLGNVSINDSLNSIVNHIEPHSDGGITYDIFKFSNSSHTQNLANPLVIVTLPSKLPEVDPTLNEVSITENALDTKIRSPHPDFNSSETVTGRSPSNALSNNSTSVTGEENKKLANDDLPIEFANITDDGISKVEVNNKQIYKIEDNTNEIDTVKETSVSENGNAQEKIPETQLNNSTDIPDSQNSNDNAEVDSDNNTVSEQNDIVSTLINSTDFQAQNKNITQVRKHVNEEPHDGSLQISPSPVANVSSSNCNIGQLQCGDGSCYSSNMKCDSVLNCFDLSDEDGCLQSDCLENFQCKAEGLCLERKFVCDGVNHCSDGEDEKGCENRECSSEEFRCGAGDLCIPVTLRCDGHPDCSNRADEINCSADCPKESFLCPEKTCIPKLWLCDGNPDCMNGEDENDCDCEGLDQSPCSVGGCVATFKLCDGLRQCPDGSDEWNCLQIDNTTQQLRVRSGGDRWSAVCSDNWTVEWTELVCEQLGFGSPLSTEFVSASNSALLPRMMLSHDAADISRRRRAPLQYFLTHGECSNDSLVLVSCKKQECGNWMKSEEGTGDTRSSEETAAEVWPSLGLLIQPRSNSTGFGEECAATVITHSWVLTSYSCLTSSTNGLDAEEWAFMIGSLKPKLGDENIQLRYLKQIVIYPGAKRWKNRWIGDGALIRLQTPLKLSSRVQPVCLPNQDEAPYHDCVVASWANDIRSNVTANRLLSYEVTQSLQKTNITDIGVCNSSIYGGLLSEHHICASFTQDKYSLCNSHKGFPLMCRNSKGLWDLHGLLSHVGNCASFNLPSVFTDVEGIDYWISNTIGLSARKEKVSDTSVKHPTPLPSFISSSSSSSSPSSPSPSSSPPPPPPSQEITSTTLATTTTNAVSSTAASNVSTDVATSPLSPSNPNPSTEEPRPSTPTEVEAKEKELIAQS